GVASTPFDPREMPVGYVRNTGNYIAFTPGGQADTIAQLFVGEGFSAPGTYLYRVPFNREAQVAVAGEIMHYGSSDDYSISTYARSGELVRVIRSPRAVP